MSAMLVPATKSHLTSIVRIERESFTDPWSKEAFVGMIDSPLALFTVALGDHGGVIGYTAATSAWEDGEILSVAVENVARGKGIGGQLLDAAIFALKEQLVARVFLEVRESNAAAIALYKSRGFTQMSVRRSYYRRPVENALVMRLDLTPK
ncbi:MAG: ribosomal protein S18-alanine N-acetyltransferase [Gemmatimonadaceae bacterium]|nr:ribosomal protein S18-alanine N-acetyltransferase [Gemmatimonadaceae bacterium]